MNTPVTVVPRHRLRDLAIRISQYCGVRKWRFTRRDNDGRAHLHKKIIETGDPVTVERLYVVAHECGHIALEHGPREPPGHRCEFEAEQFAILVLRHFDVPVPYAMVEDGQDYVAWHIECDVQRYHCHEIDRETFQWASRRVAPAIRRSVEARQIPLVDCRDARRYDRLLQGFFTKFLDVQ
jgi:hypothetical protein